MAGSADGQKTGPSRTATLALIALLLVFAAGFAALGDWQLHRRVWKLDLIARVNARVHAPPAPAPGPAGWGALTKANAEYVHVRAEGVFLNDRETTVQALSELGAGALPGDHAARVDAALDEIAATLSNCLDIDAIARIAGL